MISRLDCRCACHRNDSIKHARPCCVGRNTRAKIAAIEKISCMCGVLTCVCGHKQEKPHTEENHVVCFGCGRRMVIS